MAAVVPTPLVVLDEPTNDVEAERLVDDLVVLDRGRVVATGSPAALRSTADDLRLELHRRPYGDDPSREEVPVPVHRRVDTGRRVLLAIPASAAATAVAWATSLRDDDRIDGYALAPATLEDHLLTQVLVFFVMLFSPVTYPVTQLPTWFQAVHDVLPVRPAADLLRAGLAADVEPRDLLVLIVWCVAGLALTLRALVRRG